MYNKLVKNFLNKKKYLIILIVFIVIYIYYRSGVNYFPVENLNIPSGFGIDLTDNKQFSISMSFYNYSNENKVDTQTFTVVNRSLSNTIEKLQLYLNKKMLTGVEKSYILSEEYSKYGIKNLIDIDFKDSSINDMVILAVCKGKVEDILNFKIPSYPSAADYIEGLIKNSTENNFFSDNYKLIDVFVRIGAEGKNLVLPYIEIKDDKLEITGMSLFKKDKMIQKIDMEETRIMNLLRENNVKGILVLQENLKEYTAYHAQTSRKVRCEKKDNNYTFYIDLSLTGNILENELFPNLNSKQSTMEDFKSKMAEEVNIMCQDFILKMQKDYKIDCLELGKIAASKYGRHTGVDWDSIVANSKIIVNVNVKVDNMGRGDY